MQVESKIRQEPAIAAGAYLEVAHRLVPGLEVIPEITVRGGPETDKSTLLIDSAILTPILKINQCLSVLIRVEFELFPNIVLQII